jgi:hypothetical protein
MGEWDATTNVVYLHVQPGERRFARKERTRRDKSGRFTRRLYIRNEEGYWALLESVAILYPQPAAGSDRAAKQAAWWVSVEDSPQTNEGDVSLERPPFVAITGERFMDSERVLLRITQSLDKDAFAVAARKAKKKVPLFLRPFITTSLLERWFAQAETFRLETILDQQSDELIGQREYGIDGSLHFDYRNWVPVPDLPGNAYAVPSGLKQLRPKTLREAQQLERKFRVKEARAKKKQEVENNGKAELDDAQRKGP